MIERRTMFSPDRRYRYTLWREWDMMNPTFVQFIGLNPSTADEVQDDPTIRRCVDFAKRWGYGALCMTNLFAFRATDPKEMKSETYPIGAENDEWLQKIAAEADLRVAAWGRDGAHMNRSRYVSRVIPGLKCLKISTNTGEPYHPLYLSKLLQPTDYYGSEGFTSQNAFPPFSTSASA